MKIFFEACEKLAWEKIVVFGSAIISAKLKIPRDILYANERYVGQQTEHKLLA